MKQKYTLEQISRLEIDIKSPSLIFLYGDLGAGKTTLSQELISRIIPGISVISPTYVYYNKYSHIHHFDLYRIHDYDEFVSIGGEEILDNNEGIILVEWPEYLEAYYTPDISIRLEKGEGDERIVEVNYKK